jgi:hypothetical protein
MPVTDRLRIETAREDQAAPYTHLEPLVLALVERGNRVTLPGDRSPLFAPSQEGYVAYLADRIDWDWVQANVDLPDTVVYDPETDEVFDRRTWVSILGSQQ